MRSQSLDYGQRCSIADFSFNIKVTANGKNEFHTADLPNILKIDAFIIERLNFFKFKTCSGSY